MSTSKGVAEDAAGRVPPYYSIERFLSASARMDRPFELGFASLDPHLKLHRGSLTIVSALPGGGKTSFLMNVLLNLLEKHPDKKFIFWSLEESGYLLLAKLFLIAAARTDAAFTPGELQDTIRKSRTYLYLKRKNKNPNKKQPSGMSAALREGIDLVSHYIEARRLLLIDSPDTDAKALADTVHQLAEPPGDYELGALLLDYIQLLSPPQDGGQAGYQQIKSSMRQLRNLATNNNLPIIMGAQVTEGEQLITREGRDIEMEASLWLHLENPELSKSTPSNTKRPGSRNTPGSWRAGLKPPKNRYGAKQRNIWVQKNRHGPRIDPIALVFDGGTYSFTDPTSSAPPQEHQTHYPADLFLYPRSETRAQ